MPAKKKTTKKSTKKTASKKPATKNSSSKKARSRTKVSAKASAKVSVSGKKVSSKQMDQGIAILALVLNVIILPGVGTLVAGDTKKGLWQLILALISLPLMIVLIGIPLYLGIWIWGLVTGIKYVKASAQ